MGWNSIAVSDDEKLQRGEVQQVARRVIGMLRPWWGRIALALLCVGGQVGCLLAGPALVRHAIDAGLSDGNVGVLNLSAALYVAVAVAALLLGRLAIVLTANIGEAFLRELRVRVFRHLLDLGLDYFEREQTGRLVARMTSDMDALQELVQTGITSMTMNAMLFVGAVVVIFVLSWQLALCTLIVVPPALFATRWFRRESNRALPRGPGAHRHEPRDPAGGPRRRAGRPGVRPGAGVHGSLRGHQRGAVRGEHGDDPDLHEVLPVHGDARYRGDSRDRRDRGILCRTEHRDRRDGRGVRALPQQPVRARPAAEPAVQHRAARRVRR